MIKLHRDRDNVHSHFKASGRHKICKELLELKIQEGNLQSKHFKSRIWKKAKPQLRIETHGKCAYCEAPTDSVAHGDVEHFRPKSTYWWLAYCYDNYLYSCQICNQSYKSNNFPISGTKLKCPHSITSDTTSANINIFKVTLSPDPVDLHLKYKFNDFIAHCRNERADLIDPYKVDPEPMIKWEVDEVIKEVYIVPKSNHARSRKIAETLEEFYGLNREELKRLRWQYYDTLKRFMTMLTSGSTNNDNKQLIKDAISNLIGADKPFAGMARYFVNKVWQLQIQPSEQ